MKVFTAFSGYDSQCMALDRLGIDYELIAWSEIDKYAIQAHNAVYQQYADRNYGDICKIDWIKVPDFDLFTYSFPCQDISNAGLQRGLKEGSGTRSGLLWECRKAIEIKRPKYLLMENVKALTSEKFMPYLRKWLLFLESMGYSNFTKVLNSKDYGVPQNRERVFCVSIFGDGRYYFPKPFKLEKRLKDVLENNVDESYYLSNKMTEDLTLQHKETDVGIIYEGDVNKGGQKGVILSQNGICSALAATDYKQPKQILESELKYGNKRVQSLVDSGKINGKEVEFLDAYNQTVSELSGTIRTTIDSSSMWFITEPKIIQVGNLVKKGNFDNPQRGRVYSTKGLSPTIDNMQGGNREPKIQTNGYKIRKLTERECFRLMGVSEENIDKIQNAGISKTQQYKMAGNSIVVDVLYYIFKKLFIDKKANKGDEQILF